MTRITPERVRQIVQQRGLGCRRGSLNCPGTCTYFNGVVNEIVHDPKKMAALQFADELEAVGEKGFAGAGRILTIHDAASSLNISCDIDIK